MSTDPTARPGEQGAGAQTGPEPTEQQLREAYEAELSRVTSTDMIGQAAVSLLNIGARRLGAPSESQGPPASADPQRDLEQVRDAIDGARGLLEVLERRIPQELGPLRDALSRLQMAYAREVQLAQSAAPGESPGDPAAAAGATAPAPAPAEGGAPASGPGPAESSGRLWVPGR